jgi:hypothetical protein
MTVDERGQYPICYEIKSTVIGIRWGKPLYIFELRNREWEMEASISCSGITKPGTSRWFLNQFSLSADELEKQKTVLRLPYIVA